MERLLRTDPKYYSGQFPNYSQPPEEVDVFSLTSGGFSDDPKENLKYYIEPEENAYPFKLDNGYDIPGKFVHEWKDQEGQHDLHHILGWIKDHPMPSALSDVDFEFVTLRGKLNKVACTPYDPQGWKLAVTKFKGIWYISQDREQRKDDHQNRGLKSERSAAEEQWRARRENKQKNLYRGHKFEQYLTVDKDGKPDTDAVVDVNEGFYTVVKPKLNSHSLLFSAEIDARDPEVEDPPPAWYVEMKTNWRRQDARVPDEKVLPPACYVELKTNKKDQNATIRFYSMQQCWVQSFLVGVQKIVFGFHDKGEVSASNVQHWTAGDIKAELAKYNKEWKASVCMNFCDKFLSYVKDCATKDDPSVVYLFQREKGASVVTWKECRGSKPNLLPEWYTDIAPVLCTERQL